MTMSCPLRQLVLRLCRSARIMLGALVRPAFRGQSAQYVQSLPSSSGFLVSPSHIFLEPRCTRHCRLKAVEPLRQSPSMGFLVIVNLRYRSFGASTKLSGVLGFSIEMSNSVPEGPRRLTLRCITANQVFWKHSTISTKAMRWYSRAPEGVEMVNVCW
ncbi:hypothetical protein BU25DRAFT_25326 [Macroventuria anomochaeta]|uniref:Uncharacterized protein n=1 Tax=Macroventuria anomochaeta TaxID=301207 RepID=A0ACB6S4V8_9PLEO|nr:uncharacterized protein BU25DRAFT_25326 [Macroventuria anomochaeta]KAF2628993.1 hypothetical protein BU25DRAFT_25326 [Macroventuria anomochaeta]